MWPADFSYRNFDVHLAERKHPTERLLRMSASLRDSYSALLRITEVWVLEPNAPTLRPNLL
jgi:hypothetical protein